MRSRLINKLIPFTEAQRQTVEIVQDEIWDFYQDLKTYKTFTLQEQQQEKAALEARFDHIFTQTTSFETLNQVLRRLKRRQAELLKVLDRPDLRNETLGEGSLESPTINGGDKSSNPEGSPLPFR